MSAEVITQIEWDLEVALEKCDWLEARCAEKITAGGDSVLGLNFWTTIRETNTKLRQVVVELLQRQEQDRREGYC